MVKYLFVAVMTIIMGIGIVGCSSNEEKSSSSEKSTEQDISGDEGLGDIQINSEELEGTTVSATESPAIIPELAPEPTPEPAPEPARVVEAPVIESTPTPDTEVASVPVTEPTPAVEVATQSQNGEFRYYKMKQGETMMWVAFKLYGDYHRWHDIKRWNEDIFTGEKLAPGTKIKYIPDTSAFEWIPKGNPYLVQRGDYLGKVSMKVYDTSRLWKSIWRNNKSMIKSPDQIFAGFTLYYLNKEEAIQTNK